MTENNKALLKKRSAISVSYCIDRFRKAKLRNECSTCGTRINEGSIYIVRRREFIDENPVRYVNRTMCHECWKNS